MEKMVVFGPVIAPQREVRPPVGLSAKSSATAARGLLSEPDSNPFVCTAGPMLLDNLREFELMGFGVPQDWVGAWAAGIKCFSLPRDLLGAPLKARKV